MTLEELHKAIKPHLPLFVLLGSVLGNIEETLTILADSEKKIAVTGQQLEAQGKRLAELVSQVQGAEDRKRQLSQELAGLQGEIMRGRQEAKNLQSEVNSARGAKAALETEIQAYQTKINQLRQTVKL